MAKTYRYKFPVGDWSDDGHGKCNWFIVEGRKPIQEVREAHFAAKEHLGFDIGDICGGYEETCIKKEYKDRLALLGLEVFEEDYVGSNEIVALWIDILNFVDPGLKLVLVEDELESIVFYGFDKKKRHLRVPGYGVFF